MKLTSRFARIPVTALIVGGASALALGAGAAVATTAAFPVASAEIAAQPGGTPDPGSGPTYGTNSHGQSYGSAIEASSPETEPDLIQAEATNGQTGYVYKSDLDAASGAAAIKTFTSPEEALAWQAQRDNALVVISVYDLDGRTVIGEFVVGGG